MNPQKSLKGRKTSEKYELEVGDENLRYRQIGIADAVVTGRQILAEASVRPVDDHVVLAVLPDGSLEDIRQDETFDLSAKGAERVIVMRADATYRFFIDGVERVWRKLATGFVLKTLAGANPDTTDLLLEVRGAGDDKLIANTQVIDLSAEGVERFYTATRAVPGRVIIVNARERTVADAKVSYEQVVEFAFPGQRDGNVIFSMTYRHAASSPHSGELAAGGSIEVKEKGTIFNVTRTVQS